MPPGSAFSRNGRVYTMISESSRVTEDGGVRITREYYTPPLGADRREASFWRQVWCHLIRIEGR